MDSNEIAFRIAGAMAVKEAARKATPVVLEPVMNVKVKVREELIGMIMADLNGRRGRIEGIAQEGFGLNQSHRASRGNIAREHAGMAEYPCILPAMKRFHVAQSPEGMARVSR